jgi:hypothetical protein
MTQRLPPVRRLMRGRIRCRSRRLTRFRVTAGPTPRPTTNPTRAGPEPDHPAAGPTPHASAGWINEPARARLSAGCHTWATSVRRPDRRPALIACRNSGRRRRRRGWGSTGSSTGRLRHSRTGPALKQPAGCGPCAGERPGSPGRHGCASGDGTRASCGDAGCSAGTCACSREGSQVRCGEKEIESVTPRRRPGSGTQTTPGSRHPPTLIDLSTVRCRPPTVKPTDSVALRPAGGTFRQISGQVRLYCCGQRVVLDHSQLLASSRHRDAFPGNSQQFGAVTPVDARSSPATPATSGNTVTTPWQHPTDTAQVASTQHGPRLARRMATLGDDRPTTQRAQSVDKDVDRARGVTDRTCCGRRDAG